MKKIIGYNWKKGLKIHAKMLAKMVDSTERGLKNEIPGKKYIFTCDCHLKDKLEAASLLNLFFKPVYEEEKPFEIGDWIMTNNKTIKNHKNSNSTSVEGGSGFIPNTLLKIRKIDEHDGYSVYFFEYHLDGIYNGNFRHATSEEIKSRTIQELKDFHVEFDDEMGVKIEGFRYTIAQLRCILIVLQLNKFHSLKFGCSGQINVTEQLICSLIDRITK